MGDVWEMCGRCMGDVRLHAAASLLTGRRRIETRPLAVAPEVVRRTPYLGPPVDVWSLGVLVYELLHNRLAFNAPTLADLHVRILKGAHEKFSPAVPARVKAAVRKCLGVDAADRPEAAAAERLLRRSLEVVELEPAAAERAGGE